MELSVDSVGVESLDTTIHMARITTISFLEHTFNTHDLVSKTEHKDSTGVRIRPRSGTVFWILSE